MKNQSRLFWLGVQYLGRSSVGHGPVEVAVIVTNLRLETEDAVERVIEPPRNWMKNLEANPREMANLVKGGLVGELIKESWSSLAQAERDLLALAPEGKTVILAGESPFVPSSMSRLRMRFDPFLTYDLSLIRLLLRETCDRPDFIPDTGPNVYRAMARAQRALNEARAYQEQFSR